MRTNVYVDGFNLFYGSLRRTDFRWLDLRKLAESLLGTGHSVNRIRYFTARVKATDDPSEPQRQQTYIRAVETITGVSVHFGQYRSNVVSRPLARPPTTGSRFVMVRDSKEKGTDVNIATFLLCDAFDGDYEKALVISNDSDLTFPIETVRTKLSKPVIVGAPVSLPNRFVSKELRAAATSVREIRESALSASLLPPEIIDAAGRKITCPAKWLPQRAVGAPALAPIPAAPKTTG